jgi:hypothetical protein
LTNPATLVVVLVKPVDSEAIERAVPLARSEKGKAGLADVLLHSLGSTMAALQAKHAHGRSNRSMDPATHMPPGQEKDWAGHLSRLVTTPDSNELRTHITVCWREVMRKLLKASSPTNRNIAYSDFQPPTSTPSCHHAIVTPHHHNRLAWGGSTNLSRNF